MPDLILKSFTHHLTLVRFGTVKVSMLILSNDSIYEFDLGKDFAKKHVDVTVLPFNKTILKFLNNFILHEVIFCDDKVHHGSMKKLNQELMNNSELKCLSQKYK